MVPRTKKTQAVAATTYLLANRDGKFTASLEKLREAMPATFPEPPEGMIVVDPADILTLPAVAKTIRPMHDKEALFLAAVELDYAVKGEIASLDPITVTFYDNTVAIDGLHRAAIAAILGFPWIPAEIDIHATNETIAVRRGIARNTVRRQQTTSERTSALDTFLVEYGKGKKGKGALNVADVALDFGVSEQTVRNRLKKLSEPQGEPAQKIVTTSNTIGALTRVVLPTPIAENPDISERLLAHVASLPMTYPILDLVRLFNVLVVTSDIFAEVQKRIDAEVIAGTVVLNDYGIADIPEDEEEEDAVDAVTAEVDAEVAAVA